MSAEHPHLVRPGVTSSAYITNLGGDSFRLLFYDADETVGFEHRCDRGERGVVVCAPLLAMPPFSVVHLENQARRPTVTVEPSIHCPDCGTHGFIRNSQWIPA